MLKRIINAVIIFMIAIMLQAGMVSADTDESCADCSPTYEQDITDYPEQDGGGVYDVYGTIGSRGF